MHDAPPLLIFTDLDGTLLDHDTYSHAAADATLAKLKQLGVPVIPTTSKTRQEVERLRKELRNTDPFIVENGAAAFLPREQFPTAVDAQPFNDYWAWQHCEPRSHWQAMIGEIAAEFEGQFATYHDGGVEAVMQWTGLERASAERSSAREFSEPVHWKGTPEAAQQFSSRLESLGARVLQGGRFLHVSGACDKGAALQWVKEQYQKLLCRKDLTTIALGDSPNDIAMLQAADHPIIVRSKRGLAPNLQSILGANERLVVTEATGPEGWAEGIGKIVDL